MSWGFFYFAQIPFLIPYFWISLPQSLNILWCTIYVLYFLYSCVVISEKSLFLNPDFRFLVVIHALWIGWDAYIIESGPMGGSTRHQSNTGGYLWWSDLLLLKIGCHFLFSFSKKATEEAAVVGCNIPITPPVRPTVVGWMVLSVWYPQRTRSYASMLLSDNLFETNSNYQKYVFWTV